MEFVACGVSLESSFRSHQHVEYGQNLWCLFLHSTWKVLANFNRLFLEHAIYCCSYFFSAAALKSHNFVLIYGFLGKWRHSRYMNEVRGWAVGTHIDAVNCLKYARKGPSEFLILCPFFDVPLLRLFSRSPFSQSTFSFFLLRAPKTYFWGYS